MVDPTRETVERDRRQAERAAIRLEAAYEDLERQVFVTTSDISESGVYLVSDELPPIGLSAQITIELPKDPTILRLRGTVVRRQSVEPSGFALQFDSKAVPESHRNRVRRFVSRLAQGAATAP